MCASFCLCQLDPKLELPGRKEPQLRKRLHQIDLWACKCGIFLIVDGCGRTQFTVGDAITGQVVLGGIRKVSLKAGE